MSAMRVESPDDSFHLEQAQPPSTQLWSLDDDSVVIGRDPASDVFIDDPEVSRHHADLIRRGVGWSILDAGSANGTYVNRERVRETRLRSGDRIGIGGTELILRQSGVEPTETWVPGVGSRPGRRQVTVLHLEPTRAAATIGYLVVMLVALAAVAAALIYRTDAWPPTLRPHNAIPDRAILTAAAVAGFLALISGFAAIVNGRRWHIARAIERLSSDPAMGAFAPDNESSRSAHRAAIIPQICVRVIKPMTLPRPRGKLRRVTIDRNVVGHRPLEIAYLRLFENQPRMRTFIEGAWREFGYVHFLRSASSVTPAEYRWGTKSRDFAGLFISSREQLLAALAGSRTQPNAKGRFGYRTFGATTIKVRDRYGSYGVQALLCHGDFWKSAVDMLLDRADLVALDLSGFTSRNLGTRYELQRVIDRFPIERVVLLADQRSDTKFLTAQLKDAWWHMAAGSPNAVPDAKVAVVAVTDYFAQQVTTSQVQQGGHSTQVQTQVRIRLKARRSQTRRLVAIAQDRMDESLAGVTSPAYAGDH